MNIGPLLTTLQDSIHSRIFIVNNSHYQRLDSINVYKMLIKLIGYLIWIFYRHIEILRVILTNVFMEDYDYFKDMLKYILETIKFIRILSLI